jgi:hypothetical protein
VILTVRQIFVLMTRTFCSGIFEDSFIDHLFDLVEQTRSMQDETFNYSVIKLIVSVLFILPLMTM